MSLQLFDSLTKSKRVFVPLRPGEVKLYVCGITVYDYCHIGHARALIVFDMLTRYLRFLGFTVTYVRNITDIDDKIIQRAQENKEPYTALIERFITALHEDEQALSVMPPDIEPRATQNISVMIALVEELVAKGFAYLTDQGDVCFRVRAFHDYGKLSHRCVDDLRSGIRIPVGGEKEDPLDFVLWKAAKPGEPMWHSPWGSGRPGWHLECSAMSTCALGQPFDLHGGGLDLKFPHQENEIAQSEAAAGTVLANYWLHSGLLTVNGEKMSKSLHNFLTIRDVLAKYSAEVVRYFFLSSHYRSPINYSEESLLIARKTVGSLYMALRDLPETVAEQNTASFVSAFHEAMNDDCNTPVALSVLCDMMHAINRLRMQNQQVEAAEIAVGLKRLGAVLGLLQHKPEDYLQSGNQMVEQINRLIAERNKARAQRNWQEADRIRAQLLKMGVGIQDTVGNTATMWYWM